MNPDRRNFLAILMCVLFYVGYTQYLKTKYPNMDKDSKVTTSQENESSNPVPPAPSSLDAASATSSGSGAPNKETQVQAIAALAESELTIENSESTYIFDQSTGGVKSVRLKNYKKSPDPASEQEELITNSFAIQGTALTSAPKIWAGGFQATRSGNVMNFRRQVGPWEVDQKYILPRSGYGLELEISWKNTSEAPIDLTAVVTSFVDMSLKDPNSFAFLPGAATARPQLVTRVDGSRDQHDLIKFCSHEGVSNSPLVAVSKANFDFFGTDEHYFAKLLVPEAKSLDLMAVQAGPRFGDEKLICPIAITASQPQGLVASGQTVTLKFKGWFGPKSVELMEAYDQRLATAVDLGWFSFFAKPLFEALRAGARWTGNWGVAVILVTILLKLLFFPLTKQASVSAKKMSKLKPEMDRIRERFQDDKQQQQQEILKFMTANKINPMKGCLPILVQLPVFIAFYRILSTAIELRFAPFAGWLGDLSSADPYYITPVVLGVAQFIQQKLTPNVGMDPAQQRIMMMMPIIFTVMMLTLPSGMVLYMLVNTFVSIVQQQWLNRRDA